MQEPRRLFVDVRTRVPATEEARVANRSAHIAYLGRIKAEGKLLMGGPFEDGSGAMNIFSVSSIEEAMALCSNDPFVAGGVYRSNVRAWSARFY